MNVDSERQSFEKLFMTFHFIYMSDGTCKVKSERQILESFFSRILLKESHRKKYFFIFRFVEYVWSGVWNEALSQHTTY